ncbi:hypothetical protein [Flavobacterium columnare]|uniref:hypothetical protein n=1 Tax=Flavobacterium TaxID=237 RepID=UPI0013E2D1E8|nr:hypothetical protein [Flavobacterium columnare]
MKNLNVVELNAQELKNVEGGFSFNFAIFGFSIVNYDDDRKPGGGNRWRTDLW